MNLSKVPVRKGSNSHTTWVTELAVEIDLAVKQLPARSLSELKRENRAEVPLDHPSPSEAQLMSRLKPGTAGLTCGLSVTAFSQLALADVHFSTSQEPNYPAHKLHKRVCLIQDIFLRQVTRKERAG